ncbi:MAG: RNA polymerase sigma factor [Saprospiraceae bacterium]|nr:RNA polymerase sigma factor [Saprospiraceae bacterium]
MELELTTRQRDSRITSWFGQYGRRVLSYIQSRIRDLEVAEDTAQDVWLQLTRQEDLDQIEEVGSWLFAAARNRITDYYRKKKTIPFSQLLAEPDEEPGEENDQDLMLDQWLTDYLPDTLLESREFWDELDRALSLLPPEQREVFVAHELQEESFKDMADRTGVAINTLLARKRYAVLKLREYFWERRS